LKISQKQGLSITRLLRLEWMRNKCVNGGPGVVERRFRSLQTQHNVPAPSFLELQSERRETTELGYPGRCPRQPQKHRPGSGPPVARSLVYGPGPGSGPPVARSLVYGPGPGSSWEIGLHYRPHTWAPLGPRQGFFSAFDSFTIGTPVSNLKLGR
jgi:hypothetical protein